jgi:hypothetical protein
VISGLLQYAYFLNFIFTGLQWTFTNIRNKDGLCRTVTSLRKGILRPERHTPNAPKNQRC